MQVGKAGVIHRLIKIGKREHILSLIEDGILYMKPIRFFNQVENNSQQNDNFEGATHFKTFIGMVITTSDGKEIKFGSASDGDDTIENGNMLFHPEVPMGNIYCMLAITQELIDSNSRIDKRNKEFGDTILVIKNPKLFLERVCKVLNEKDIEYEYGLVEYFDRNQYEGKLTPFKKRTEYSHQYEFRFLIKNIKEGDFILEIGSIKDIAVLYSLEDASDLFESETN